MTERVLMAEKEYLANLLEALQRCIYFLESVDNKIPWPLDEELLTQKKKDVALFESLAAMNERFAKLQDTLGIAMRHASILSGESADSFLKILAFYEKVGVIESVATWQSSRSARNLAAHDYEIRYARIAEHFNTLHELRVGLYRAADKFLRYCQDQLAIAPASEEFSAEYGSVVLGLACLEVK